MVSIGSITWRQHQQPKPSSTPLPCSGLGDRLREDEAQQPLATHIFSGIFRQTPKQLPRWGRR